jgi:hypothetical protein
MNKELVAGLAWGIGILAVALGATFARKLGYIESETVTRIVIGMNGLMIVYYGNGMPKSVVPSAYARQIKRVGGWAMVLSGFVYAGMFAFAPIPAAVTVGCGAVVAGMAATLGYSLWLLARVKTA